MMIYAIVHTYFVVIIIVGSFMNHCMLCCVLIHLFHPESKFYIMPPIICTCITKFKITKLNLFLSTLTSWLWVHKCVPIIIYGRQHSWGMPNYPSRVSLCKFYESLGVDFVSHLAWVSFVHKWHDLCKYMGKELICFGGWKSGCHKLYHY